jgi:hypothetical protein
MIDRDKRIAERLHQMPIASRKTYLKVTTGKAAPRTAIKAFCAECVGWERAAVRECTAPACPLWMYRPYQTGTEPLLEAD